MGQRDPGAATGQWRPEPGQLPPGPQRRRPAAEASCTTLRMTTIPTMSWREVEALLASARRRAERRTKRHARAGGPVYRAMRRLRTRGASSQCEGGGGSIGIGLKSHSRALPGPQTMGFAGDAAGLASPEPWGLHRTPREPAHPRGVSRRGLLLFATLHVCVEGGTGSGGGGSIANPWRAQQVFDGFMGLIVRLL